MDVRQVAKLAHLEISDAEVELYTPQMANIVKYVEQLNELDIEDIEPMLGGLTDEGKTTFAIREDISGGSLGQTAACRRRRRSLPDIFRCQRFSNAKVKSQKSKRCFLILPFAFLLLPLGV